MKKIIYLLFMAVVGLPSLRASDIADPVMEGPKFTITFEMGKGPECFWAWRLCRVTVGDVELSQGPSGTIESLSKTSGGGSGGGGGKSWMLSFSRQNFAKYYPDFLVNLDGKETVTFEGSYVLPSEIRDGLGSAEDLVIRENTAYPLRYENGNFIITFP